jgi:multicomponent Na+:H+ antiporter subunit D
MGVGGAFSTADLFNMYVWFEVMLIASVGILAIEGRAAHFDASFKYLSLNLVGTLFLLTGVAFTYGSTGHLNFGALGPAQAALEPGLRTAILGLLVLAFLIKAGAFPFFAWLPASYHTLPGPILALFAGLLTKVGVYAVLRILGGVFAPAPSMLTDALGWIAALTMITGVLGAAYHWDIRRILAFHIISQIGYILLGVALATNAGHAATVFYTIHHIIVKSNLFLVGAMIARLTGSYDLRNSGGLYKACPLLALIFLIPALSLVGIPPLSGFWAKLLVLSESVGQNRIAWTAAALIVSMLTLYSMMKIWLEAFWKAHPDPQWAPPQAAMLPAYVVTIGLAMITLWIGLNPESLSAVSLAAVQTLGAKP